MDGMFTKEYYLMEEWKETGLSRRRIPNELQAMRAEADVKRSPGVCNGRSRGVLHRPSGQNSMPQSQCVTGYGTLANVAFCS